MSRPLSFYQRAYDAREPAEETLCDGGMVTCQRCGRTGRDPLAYRCASQWEDDGCRDCSGDGVVPCPGCSECGRGESPSVIGEAAE